MSKLTFYLVKHDIRHFAHALVQYIRCGSAVLPFVLTENFIYLRVSYANAFLRKISLCPAPFHWLSLIFFLFSCTFNWQIKSFNYFNHFLYTLTNRTCPAFFPIIFHQSNASFSSRDLSFFLMFSVISSMLFSIQVFSLKALSHSCVLVCVCQRMSVFGGIRWVRSVRRTYAERTHNIRLHTQTYADVRPTCQKCLNCSKISCVRLRMCHTHHVRTAHAGRT